MEKFPHKDEFNNFRKKERNYHEHRKNRTF